MRWPWEARAQDDAASGDYTAQRLAADDDVADRGAGAATAAVATASNLFVRCLSAATIAPEAGPVQALTAAHMAWAGRQLVVEGEALFAIVLTGDQVILQPVASHDIVGDNPDPRTWRYRVDVPAPTGLVSRHVMSDGVLHLIWNRRTDRPWKGISPISEAGISTDLHRRIVSNLKAAMKESITGQALEVDPEIQKQYDIGQYLEIKDALREQLRGHARKGLLPFLPPGITVTAVDRQSASAAEVQLHQAAANSILSACGISPALYAESGDGSGQREAWRRFWIASVAPLGATIETELRAKLDPGATVTFSALRASDEDGRSRAAARRAAAWKIFRDGDLNDGEARRLAGLET